MIPENFVGWLEAQSWMTPDERRRAHAFPSEHIPARDVIGRQTGLDMDKYDLVPAVNRLGWYIEKRVWCLPCHQKGRDVFLGPPDYQHGWRECPECRGRFFGSFETADREATL